MLAIRLLRTVAVVVVTVAATLAPGIAAASDDDVPVTEYITLPKFCWYQFSGGKVLLDLAPAEGILNCGHHMNHYCYALLDLQRAKRAKSLDRRQMHLKSARISARYTWEGMKMDGTTATCSITPHVQATLRDIDLQMQLYHVK